MTKLGYSFPIPTANGQGNSQSSSTYVDIGDYYVTKGNFLNNELYTWGRNAIYSAGVASASSPVQIGSRINWKLLDTGAAYLALDHKNDLYAWAFDSGAFTIGTIGAAGASYSLNSPVLHDTFATKGRSWRSVATASTGTAASGLAIRDDGTLWSVGGNFRGTLGLGDNSDRSTPVQVGTLTNWKSVFGNVYSVAFGINTSNQLYYWGQDNGAQNSPTFLSSTQDWATVVNTRSNITASDSYTTFCLKTDRSLWGTGYNYYSLVPGFASNGYIGKSPVAFFSDKRWLSVAFADYAIGITTDGSLWSWGSGNTFGQLGIGNTTAGTSSPVQIGSLTNWKQVAVSGRSVAAVKSDGTLWVWGENTSGSLGLGDLVHRSSPVQLGSRNKWSAVYGIHPTANLNEGKFFAVLSRDI